jgi:hypothetical protein
MIITAVLGIVFLGQAPAEKAKPKLAPLALHLGIELDDLDLEVRRQHRAVLAARNRVEQTERAARRGVVSPEERQQVIADLRYQEAKEAEVLAYRAIKIYERDVLSGQVAPDAAKSLDLLVDLIKAQEAMAQADLDFRALILDHNQQLLQRGTISRQERDTTQLDYDVGRHNVALCEARLALVALQRGQLGIPNERHPSEIRRLKLDYLRARIRYYEIGADLAKLRFEMARDRLRINRISAEEVKDYETSYRDATAAVEAERKRLDNPDADLPLSLPRTG